MGLFATGIHLSSTDRAAVVEAVKSVACVPAFVARENSGRWVSVFPQATETQDQQKIRVLCQSLSKHLQCAVLATLVHDSDIFWFIIFDNGVLRTEYDSDPGYFDGADLPPRGGKTSEVLPFCNVSVTETAIRRVLHQKSDSVFSADEIAERFAQLIGVPEDAFTLGFNYIHQDQDERFELIADGAKPKSSGNVVDFTARLRQRAEANAPQKDPFLGPGETLSVAGYQLVIPNGWTGRVNHYVGLRNVVPGTKFDLRARREVSSAKDDAPSVIVIGVDPRQHKEANSLEELLKLRKETHELENFSSKPFELKLTGGPIFSMARWSGTRGTTDYVGTVGQANVSHDERLFVYLDGGNDEQVQEALNVFSTFRINDA